MSPDPLIFIPRLHREPGASLLPAGALHLWPGLPNPQEGFYVPDAFPLTPPEAAQYLDDMRSAGMDAARNIPVHSLLAAEKQTQRRGDVKEASDLADFAAGKTPETDMDWRMREAGIAAQKALLRVWMQEEDYLETLALEERCRSLSEDFDAALGVDLTGENADALRLARRMHDIDESAGCAVSWSFVLENAALFLPERCSLLFTDSVICAELRENTPYFVKVKETLYFSAPFTLRQPPESAAGALWQALGMNGPRPECPWLAKSFSFILLDAAQ